MIDRGYELETLPDDFFIRETMFTRRGSKFETLERQSWNDLPDLEYLRKKILRTSGPQAAVKYRKQYVLSSFPFDHAKARNFLKKLLDT